MSSSGPNNPASFGRFIGLYPALLSFLSLYYNEVHLKRDIKMPLLTIFSQKAYTIRLVNEIRKKHDKGIKKSLLFVSVSLFHDCLIIL